MAKKKKEPIFRDSIPYGNLLMYNDIRLIREYCLQTPCSECLMLKNGFTGCKDVSEYIHPLEDPSYVKACANLLIKNGFSGADEYIKNFLDRMGL